MAQERRGNLPRSIEKRQGSLRAFGRWLAPRGLLDASREDVETFLDRRKGQGGRKIHSRTGYVWLSHFKAFYRWAMVEELVERDPTAAIIRPKMRRTLPRPIDDDDLAGP